MTKNSLMFAVSLIHWKSKQQTIAAQSSKEAELLSVAACVRDVLWKKKIFNNDEKGFR